MDGSALDFETVGHPAADSVVPLESLQALYLPRNLSSTDGSALAGSTLQNAAPTNKSADGKADDDEGNADESGALHLSQCSASALQSRLPSRTIKFTPITLYPPIRILPHGLRKRILVTGGAGFVGSHLVDRLMLMGHEVIVLDNMFTGSKSNIATWIGHPNFELVRRDVVDPFLVECDQIYHLACPASPPHYQYNPTKTLKTGFVGTLNMLGLAKRTKARFLLASTSEVYGDPQFPKQREDYWGNVNCNGPRACYDEGKRVAETLTQAYMRQDCVDVRIVRIFNTYGPRMDPGDGRVVSNFIMQALRGEPLTIYGEGSQTRSFQYIHDLIDGLILLMNNEHEVAQKGPVNIGTQLEYTMLELAEMIRSLVVEINAEDAAMAASSPDHRSGNRHTVQGVSMYESKTTLSDLEVNDVAPATRPKDIMENHAFEIKSPKETNVEKDFIESGIDSNGAPSPKSSQYRSSSMQSASHARTPSSHSRSQSGSGSMTPTKAPPTVDVSPMPSWTRRNVSAKMGGIDEPSQTITDARKPVEIIHLPAITDDPTRRCADNGLAKEILGWEPRWQVDRGLRETIRYFKAHLQRSVR